MIEIPNFTVEKELGRGGMATVYLAVQDMLSRKVALKVMLPDMARDENFRNSFLSEGKIIANLEHPNIVRIHDFGIIDDSILYMAMEHLSDGTLKEKVADGKLSYGAAVKILEDTSAGLSYAHAKGYIHRDIKPGNILFREDGTAVITDFGIAKLQDTSGELTRMGYTMGTVQYMSPEQAVTTDLDHRSDIYSLGLVFYEMLTGQKAFKAESTIQAIHQHTTVAPPELPPKYSFLQPTIDKVLAKEPADRFQNINDFVNAVKNAREVDETVIHKISPPIDDDKTQILRTGQYQVQQPVEKKSHTGKFVGIASILVLLGGLAFGVTKYPEINPWLNKENPNKSQKVQEAQQAPDMENKQLVLKQQEELANKEKIQQLAEKEQQRKIIEAEKEKQREVAAAEIKKQETEKLERDRVLAEKIATAKKQAEENEKTAESERQRELAEAELKKLEAEKVEKDKALALKIANAKKQAEEDRIKAEAQLQKIEAEKKERERILAVQIAKAKKQAEDAEKARVLAENERIAADKLKKEQQAEEKLKQAQLEEVQKREEQERLVKLELERKQQEEIAKLEKEKISAQQEQDKLKLALAEKKKSEEAEKLKIKEQEAEQAKLAKQQEQEKIELALAEKNRLNEEQLQLEKQKIEQERLDAEIALLRKQKEDKLEKERIAEKKRKDKITREKKAKQDLARKKARDAKKKKDLARQKANQEKKRKLAILAKKKAEAARRKQQAANSRGQIRVSATLNGRPLNTTFIVTKNGKRIQTVGGRSSANFVLPAGRYVVSTQYSGKASSANVHLEPFDIVTQGFAFRGSAPVRQAKPAAQPAQKKWEHEHKY